MAAILGLGADQVEQVCGGVGGIVGIAAINAPTQIVISGEAAAVASAAEGARTAGARRVIPLDVSVAAHSPLMKQAESDLRPALASALIVEPIVPFVSCVSGTLQDDPTGIAALLCDALTRPVLWVETVQTLAGIGVDRFLEVGPGKVLSGLVPSTLAGADVTPVGDDESIAHFAGQLAGELTP
jgi:[acyl-carrier-protein] S-malonyltransferase